MLIITYKAQIKSLKRAFIFFHCLFEMEQGQHTFSSIVYGHLVTKVKHNTDKLPFPSLCSVSYHYVIHLMEKLKAGVGEAEDVWNVRRMCWKLT